MMNEINFGGGVSEMSGVTIAGLNETSDILRLVRVTSELSLFFFWVSCLYKTNLLYIPQSVALY